MKLLKQKHLSHDDQVIYLKLFQMHKSFLLLISDQELMGIGNVTLSSPPIIQGLKATSASYNLFGMKENLLSKIIAEKSSSILRAPVLLLLFLKSIQKEEEILKPLVTFLKEILEEVIKERDNE